MSINAPFKSQKVLKSTIYTFIALPIRSAWSWLEIKKIKWVIKWRYIFYCACVVLIFDIYLLYTILSVYHRICRDSRIIFIRYKSKGWSKWVSDCWLTPTRQYFSYITTTTSSCSMRWWWDPLCTRPTRLVGVLLIHIILIPSTPVFALSSQCGVLSG